MYKNNIELIANNIMETFGYDGYKSKNLYRNDLGGTGWHPELTVHVPSGLYSEDITFYKRNKLFGKTPYDYGIAREYKGLTFFIIQGGVIVIDNGEIVFDEII